MKVEEDYYETNEFIVGTSNMGALGRYSKDKIEPGGFLRAVLEGDLYNACGRADIENQQRLYHIIRYICSTVPIESYGSPEKVKKWLKK